MIQDAKVIMTADGCRLLFRRPDQYLAMAERLGIDAREVVGFELRFSPDGLIVVILEFQDSDDQVIRFQRVVVEVVTPDASIEDGV